MVSLRATVQTFVFYGNIKRMRTQSYFKFRSLTKRKLFKKQDKSDPFILHRPLQERNPKVITDVIIILDELLSGIRKEPNRERVWSRRRISANVALLVARDALLRAQLGQLPAGRLVGLRARHSLYYSGNRARSRGMLLDSLCHDCSCHSVMLSWPSTRPQLPSD